MSTAGEIMARLLQAEGVRHVFGLPDSTYLSLLSGLRALNISLITPRHETTAVHMAGAYARLSGELGVCIASNGPGVANALSGVAVENAEGNRVLFITSSRRAALTYPDRGGTYQYFDQQAVLQSLTKWSASSPAERIPELLGKALRMCYTGRPGVVHLDVPENVINGKCPIEKDWVPKPHAHHELRPGARFVEQAADMLVEARLPIIHAGGGILHAGAGDRLAVLADLLQAPVLTSWSGRSAVAETSPLVWPMIHIGPCSDVRNAADLVLCLGSRLGETDFWGKPPYWRPAADQSLIRVDIDEAVLELNRPADLPILADAGPFLEELTEALRRKVDRIDVAGRRRRIKNLARARDKEKARLLARLEDTSAPMLTGHVATACQDIFAEDAVAVFDGGNTAVWGQFYHTVKAPNTLLSTPHFGHLGAGPGQTLGAALARPGKQVFCMIGDGAFGFNLQEIETAVRYGLPVVFLVVCDKQWGMVKMSQQIALKPMKTILKKSLDPQETIGTELGEIAYDRLAQAMGAYGERVSDPAELRPALERCLESGRCSVIHVDVDPVKHMWAPGLKDFKKMHQEPEGN